MTDEEINYQTKRIKIEDVASYNKTIFETICKRKVQILSHILCIKCSCLEQQINNFNCQKHSVFHNMAKNPERGK